MLSVTAILTVIGAYLLGGVPWGLLLGQWLRGIDIRRYGSGKTGATNAARILGWRLSLAVLILDLVKGFAVVLLARWLTGAPLVEALAGIAAIAGHCWSPYIRFSGGRGVSTGIGAALAIAPGAVLAVAPAGLIVIGVTRYVSLASIAGAVTVALGIAVGAALGLVAPEYILYGVVGAAIIVGQHHDNIQRLLAGTERRLGDKERLSTTDSASASTDHIGAPRR